MCRSFDWWPVGEFWQKVSRANGIRNHDRCNKLTHVLRSSCRRLCSVGNQIAYGWVNARVDRGFRVCVCVTCAET